MVANARCDDNTRSWELSVNLANRRITNRSRRAAGTRRGRILVPAIASAALGLASIGLVSSPASASTRLGGVSVYGACQNQWPGFWQVALIANNVYGWKCQFNGSAAFSTEAARTPRTRTTTTPTRGAATARSAALDAQASASSLMPFGVGGEASFVYNCHNTCLR